jgi:CBS domain containing-hemolysin-like protein
LIDAPLRWFFCDYQLAMGAQNHPALLLFLSIYIMLFWLLPESGELPLLQVFSSRSFLLWLAAMLLLSILLAWAEMITTQIIQQNPERWALRWIDYIHYLERGFSPFLVPALLLSPAKQSFTQFRHLVTEDELKSMVDASEQGGVLEQEERKMIYSIFELGDTVVREIMVPRIDIVALPSQASISDALQTLNESGFSSRAGL